MLIHISQICCAKVAMYTRWCGGRGGRMRKGSALQSKERKKRIKCVESVDTEEWIGHYNFVAIFVRDEKEREEERERGYINLWFKWIRLYYRSRVCIVLRMALFYEWRCLFLREKIKNIAMGLWGSEQKRERERKKIIIKWIEFGKVWNFIDYFDNFVWGVVTFFFSLHFLYKFSLKLNFFFNAISFFSCNCKVFNLLLQSFNIWRRKLLQILQLFIKTFIESFSFFSTLFVQSQMK